MRRLLAFATLSLVALSASASAQRGRGAAASSSNGETPIEFGLDAGLSFGLDGQNKVTDFEIPLQQIRAGFHVSPTWSLEPAFGFSRQSSGGDSFTQTMIGVGALYHFSPYRTQNQIYVRPFFNFFDVRSTVQVTPTTKQTTSDNANEFGAGLGVKLPWKDRMSWRLEGNYAHESQALAGDSKNRLGLLFGLSYFTR